MSDSLKLNLTPEQLVRLADIGKELMGKSQLERNNLKLILSGMIKAYESETDSEAIEEDEIDDDVLEAIEEMRQDPEFDLEILDEMEKDYRASFENPISPPAFPWYGPGLFDEYATAGELAGAFGHAKTPPVREAGDDELRMVWYPDENERLIVEFTSQKLTPGTRISVPHFGDFVFPVSMYVEWNPTTEEQIKTAKDFKNRRHIPVWVYIPGKKRELKILNPHTDRSDE